MRREIRIEKKLAARAAQFIASLPSFRGSLHGLHFAQRNTGSHTPIAVQTAVNQNVFSLNAHARGQRHFSAKGTIATAK